jgi:SpoVK/Ycf46/Vps4 family AAA+-type ATPase
MSAEFEEAEEEFLFDEELELTRLEIRWPRTDGELGLWTDLLVAKALLLAHGEFPAPPMGIRTACDRLEYVEVTGRPKRRSRRREPVLCLECSPEDDRDTDLLTEPGRTLRWTSETLRFLREVRDDRADALGRLDERPVRQMAATLAGRLSLEPADAELLCVFALIQNDPILRDVLEAFDQQRSFRLSNVIATLAGLELGVARQSLGRGGRLRQLRLLSGFTFRLDELCASAIQPMLEALAHAAIGDRDPLAHFLTEAPPAKLAVADYPHLPIGFELLRRVLAQATESRRRGVNLLIHGAPGTGKTELSRLLAQELGARAFEVPLVEGDGDPRRGDSRISALVVAQQALTGQDRPLLIFDEAEDVFPAPDSPFAFFGEPSVRKGWFNRLLETNRVPVIWIANAVQHLDPATLRRFDLVVELPPPPRAKRLELVDAGLAGSGASEAWRAELAELEDLSPAELERITRTAPLLADLDASKREAELRTVFAEVRRAAGRSTVAPGRPLPQHYRPEYTRASANLVTLAEGLCRTRSGRLCLHGPPGTGKSAWAQYLARQLGAPLHSYRASDLLSKWFGETEQQLAKAFERATREQAVLLIDEVDSFLTDRRQAQHRWEVSQVNELLTQMERYEGMLVMCTNAFEHLDPAAMRRFDLRIRFGYLDDTQRHALFEECITRYALPCPPLTLEHARQRLSKLTQLAPGDFHTVLRRGRLIGLRDVGQFVDGLAEEMAARSDGAVRVVGGAGNA